jgi:hypothetical protein
MFDFGVILRLDGGFSVLARWMIVLDNSHGRLSFRVVESDEISHQLWMIPLSGVGAEWPVRWDMLFQMQISHASSSFGDNWAQG